jgi:hypothetical protein
MLNFCKRNILNSDFSNFEAKRGRNRKDENIFYKGILEYHFESISICQKRLKSLYPSVHALFDLGSILGFKYINLSIEIHKKQGFNAMHYPSALHLKHHYFTSGL